MIAMRFVRGLVLLAGALLATAPAQAAWMRAETDHFVVYENGREAEVRALASDLERFDGFIRLMFSTPEVPGSRSNKLTVWVVPDVGTVQQLCGRCSNVYGFYEGRASGSVAFTPRRIDDHGAAGEAFSARIVLFHEYGHHFLLGNYATAYPGWFSEGFAEFVSTMRIGAKVEIGVPAQHRAYGLFNGPRLSATVLFDPLRRKTLSGGELESLYGRGWLLTHWIMFDKDRRAKLSQYLTLLNTGTPSLAAATKAFGDLDALDRELDRYLNRSRIPAVGLDRWRVPEPSVTVAPLSEGADAMVAFRLVSTRGVNAQIAASLHRKAAPVAAKFPGDAIAQGWFAEIATDAGEDAAAAQALDRAIAADPSSAQAMTYRAMLAMRAAGKAKDAAAWDAARHAIVKANRADPDRALPLVLFYSSFEQEGKPPRPSAIAGLYRAQELVPQDDGLRLLAARQLIRDGALQAARRMLAPLAYNPHAPADNPATRAIERLDANDAPGASAIIAGEDKTDDGKTRGD